MEIVALLTEAKAMGLDISQIILAFGTYTLLKRDLMKVFNKQFDNLITAIKSLEASHNKRLENHEDKFITIEKKIETMTQRKHYTED